MGRPVREERKKFKKKDSQEAVIPTEVKTPRIKIIEQHCDFRISIQ